MKTLPVPNAAEDTEQDGSPAARLEGISSEQAKKAALALTEQGREAARALAELFPPNPYKHGRHTGYRKAKDGERKKKAVTNDGQPVTEALLVEHLTGRTMRGSLSGFLALGYLPVLKQGDEELTNVAMFDFDIDKYDGEDPAAALQADVDRLVDAATIGHQMPVYLERSTRGAGRHVFLFLDAPVPIKVAKGALRGLARAAQLTNAETVETYPLGEDGHSRWYITPYARALDPGHERPGLGTTYLETITGEPIYLADALDMIERADAKTFAAFAPEGEATPAETTTAPQPVGDSTYEAFTAALLKPPATGFERHSSAKAALNIFERMGRAAEGRAFLESDELRDAWLESDGTRTAEEWAEEVKRWAKAEDKHGRRYGFPYLVSQGFDLRGVNLQQEPPPDLEDAIAAAEAAEGGEQPAAVSEVWRALIAKNASHLEAEEVIKRMAAALGLTLGVLRKDYAEAKKATKPPTRLRTRVGEYAIHGGVMCLVKDHNGPNGQVDTVHVPLGNFQVEIIESVSRDDGVERTRHYVVRGKSQDGRELPAATVTARDFDAMNWPTIEWGNAAVVYAGAGQRDHLRVAAHLLSNPENRTLYTHTGWREIESQWVYLHGAGVIGRDDDTPEVQVELDGPLSAYIMPPRPSREEAAVALRILFRTLDLAPARVTAALLMAVFRALLGDADLTLHLVGLTGLGKSQLAALMQQASGAGMTSDRLPGSWTSTANALEMLAFSAKDELLVVDDFNPTGSRTDQDRYHATYERLGRAVGNSSGRGRLRPDGTLRPVRPPRALILSTGEDIPKGHSLRARLFILELQPGDLDWRRLTPAQAEAAAGRHATARAGFISWLAAELPNHRAAFEERRRLERQNLPALTGHPRTADNAAQLLATWATVREYAEDLGFSQAELADLESRIRGGILEAAAAQADHQAAADPVQHFFNLLGSLITSGGGHLADTYGDCPGEGWGWRQVRDPLGAARMTPQGQRLGWHAGEEIYLNPDTAFAAANRLGEAQSEPLPVTKQTLWKRLAERGLLSTSLEGGKTRHTFKRTVEGMSRRVLVIPYSTLPEVGKVGSNPQTADDEGENPLPTPESEVGRVGNQAEKVGSRNPGRPIPPEGAPL